MCAVATGEEDEETIFTARGKLYFFDKSTNTGSWKERGTGVVKLNTPSPNPFTSPILAAEGHDSDDEPAEPVEKRARLVMRNDGVYRVILNTSIIKDMSFVEKGGKQILFTALENGNPVQMSLKVC
jgi:Ran-binding protein 3